MILVIFKKLFSISKFNNEINNKTWARSHGNNWNTKFYDAKIINKKRLYKLKTHQIQEGDIVATYVEAKLYVMDRNLPVQFKNHLDDEVVNPGSSPL